MLWNKISVKQSYKWNPESQMNDIFTNNSDNFAVYSTKP